MTQVKTHVRIASGRLSDGRELFYFSDDDRSVPAWHEDGRNLPADFSRPSLRFDALTGEWVTIAGHRQDRTHLPPDDECPLCPSTERRATEVPATDYDVVVFENRFPSYAPTVGDAVSRTRGLFRQSPAAGRCEVICFTSDHTASFSQLPRRRVRTILDAWIHRSLALSKLASVEQVFCFENRGEEIGVTLSHPHGQIYAYPFITPRTERMLERARLHRNARGGNLFADVLAAERSDGERVVVRGNHWTAFVPFAARWPIEVHLYPNRRVPALADLDEEERQEFCSVYLELLRRVEAAFGDPIPYISAWHQAPVRGDDELAYLHLELFSIRRAPGKLKYVAGSESAMGAFINDVLPEETARALRDVQV